MRNTFLGLLLFIFIDKTLAESPTQSNTIHTNTESIKLFQNSEKICSESLKAKCIFNTQKISAPMNENEQLISNFYQAFQKKDWHTMQKSYADNAVFNDAVFKNLNANQTRNMWEMLIKKGKELVIEYKIVESTGNVVKAQWKATYLFSDKNRKVVNYINAEFLIENSKIVKHTDTFSFYKWARQALGFPGLVFGGTRFLKKRVRAGALQNLEKFIATNK